MSYRPLLLSDPVTFSFLPVISEKTLKSTAVEWKNASEVEAIFVKVPSESDANTASVN